MRADGTGAEAGAGGAGDWDAGTDVGAIGSGYGLKTRPREIELEGL